MHLFSIDGQKAFNADKRIKKRLILTENLITEMLCYSPGQGTVAHHHISEDEVFYVVEGRGVITVGDNVYEVGPTSVVFAPAPEPHSLQAADDSRMVVMYVRSPGRNATRTGVLVQDEQVAAE